MKLEPVAWQFRFKHNLGEWRGCSSGDALLYGNLAEYETRSLYAIPEGYKVVPVEPKDEDLFRAWVKVANGTIDDIDRFQAAYKATIEGEQ